MNHCLASRIAAMLLIGVVFAVYTHGENKKWGLLGRQAYIDNELADFDSNMVKPELGSGMIIAGCVVAAAVFGLYELVAFVFSELFKRMLPSDTNQQHTPTPPSHPFG